VVRIGVGLYIKLLATSWRVNIVQNFRLLHARFTKLRHTLIAVCGIPVSEKNNQKNIMFLIARVEIAA